MTQIQFAPARQRIVRGIGAIKATPMRDEDTGERRLSLQVFDEDWVEQGEIEVSRAMIDWLLQELPELRQEVYSGKPIDGPR